MTHPVEAEYPVWLVATSSRAFLGGAMYTGSSRLPLLSRQFVSKSFTMHPRTLNERLATFASVAVLLASAACTFTAGRESAERAANSRIGKLPGDAFNNVRGVQCNQDQCTRIDDRGCQISYSIDKESGRISAWRYVGDPKPCWRYTHGG